MNAYNPSKETFDRIVPAKVWEIIRRNKDLQNRWHNLNLKKADYDSLDEYKKALEKDMCGLEIKGESYFYKHYLTCFLTDEWFIKPINPEWYKISFNFLSEDFQDQFISDTRPIKLKFHEELHPTIFNVIEFIHCYGIDEAEEAGAYNEIGDVASELLHILSDYHIIAIPKINIAEGKEEEYIFNQIKDYLKQKSPTSEEGKAKFVSSTKQFLGSESEWEHYFKYESGNYDTDGHDYAINSLIKKCYPHFHELFPSKSSKKKDQLRVDYKEGITNRYNLF